MWKINSCMICGNVTIPIRYMATCFQHTFFAEGKGNDYNEYGSSLVIILTINVKEYIGI